MQDEVPWTVGVDHVGLAVGDLAQARQFFCECLGWNVVGENQSYPTTFVSDGNGVVTLWQVEDPDSCVAFDRRRIVETRGPDARDHLIEVRVIHDNDRRLAPEFEMGALQGFHRCLKHFLTRRNIGEIIAHELERWRAVVKAAGITEN